MADTEVPNTIEAGADVSVSSKSKKALKLLKGTGIKKVDGITRVVVRKRGGVAFVIEKPDVYRTPNGSYIVLGEPRLQQQDLGQQLAQMTGQDAPGAADKSPEAVTADLEAAVKNASIKDDAEEEDDAEVDTTGLDEDKIQMIMDQANTSKAKAVKALREHGGDLVNTLMALTS